MEKIREEKYKIDELGSHIGTLRWEFSFLFKDSQGLSNESGVSLKDALEIFATANVKEEVIKAFKEIYIGCLPSCCNPQLPDDDLDDYRERLIIFSNLISPGDLINYLKEDNPQLTEEKIVEARGKAQYYLKVINEIKDIRREIYQNKFENHFPNKKKIWDWIAVAFMVGIIIPLLLLLILESFFSINEPRILSLIAASMLVAFVYALAKAAALIIKDATSERTEAVAD
ncbi:MAG: hypothetical protein PHS47_01860 [Methanocellales archaeon]|nr:hypothetical protein [Methanocellales archaeon]